MTQLGMIIGAHESFFSPSPFCLMGSCIQMQSTSRPLWAGAFEDKSRINRCVEVAGGFDCKARVKLTQFFPDFQEGLR